MTIDALVIIPGGFVSSKVVPPAESVTGTNSYIGG